MPSKRSRRFLRAPGPLMLWTTITAVLLLHPAAGRADDNPATVAPGKKEKASIQWGPLLGHTATFLAVSHTFRWATEYGTREATLNGRYFHGVRSALGSLHGWGDGDEFLCNFVAHPMEGAVSGYIFSHNDPKYREEEFGKNRAYWRGKARAFAFSTVYSLQFEIGPVSEATIGKIQAYWPQNGLVDWVVTPTIGLAWTLAEDALDQYIAIPIEGKVRNPALRAVIRSWLNPSRSFANLMMLKQPWHRHSRPGVLAYDPEIHRASAEPPGELTPELDSSDPYGRKRARFVFDLPFEVTRFERLSCLGSGTTAQIPVGRSWDAVIDLKGCKLVGLPRDVTGDSLTYMVGASWSPKTAGRTVPRLRAMIGGRKVYMERTYPDLREKFLSEGVKGTDDRDVYLSYTQNWHTNGLTVSVGAGVDLGLNRAIGLRLASIDYMRSWLGTLEGASFNSGIRLSTGLIIHMGSW